MKHLSVLVTVIAISFFSHGTGIAENRNLPVIDPVTEGYRPIPATPKTRYVRNISNDYTTGQIYGAVKNGDKKGLFLDMTAYGNLLDGTVIDPSAIYGKVYSGPYPFESSEVQYTYKRFRKSDSIKNGKARIRLDYYFRPPTNSEDWKTGGQVMLRVELMLARSGKTAEESKDISLGTYDVIIRFRLENGNFIKIPAIIEGPMVNLITSDSTDKVVIAYRTGEPVKTAVLIQEGNLEKITRIESPENRKHEVTIPGLKPSTLYRYSIDVGGYSTRWYTFNTAPEAGVGQIVFAYSGDGRSGPGGPAYNLMGMNYATMERNANLAYQKGAQFFVMGGDLMNGYTVSVDDFRTQIRAWKQSMAGFWHQRPVYACLGNHEAILRLYEKHDTPKDRHLLSLDRWPYETDSAEAVFADELVHPENGPKSSDPRRPSYDETVYSFRYGPVKFIAFNNNYWISRSRHPRGIAPKRFGGCPEGYILEDQMVWIKKEIDSGETDPAVKYIILFAQEPVFPNGGHPQDCMFYLGDNNVRAYIKNAQTGKLENEGIGILDVRNRLVRLAGNSKKVAAVLGCDEHSYHKTLIDNTVPIGNPDIDDKNRDNIICRGDDGCSALTDLKYPTWYIVSGGSGAPYYSEQETPWNAYWKKNPGKYPKNKHTSLKGTYYYSSQENIIVFETSSTGISAVVYNPYGEIIDKIDNLMAVKD